MERISIGVAAKDEAEVEITGTTISEARNFAVAVYIKKPEYGPAKVKAGGLKTSDPFLVQTGSEMIVNGETIATRDFDVERLYDEQILGN